MKEISWKIAILFLGLIVVSHLFLLSKLIFFPYPELYIYPYLTNHGLLPYKQIFDQHFPGLFFLPLNFAKLGLLNQYDARFWQYGLVTITQFSLFYISAKVLNNKIKALFVALLYLIWQPFFQGWVLWINNIMPIFYLWSFYLFVLFKQRKQIRWIFWSGFLLGIATVFKQVGLLSAGVAGLYLLLSSKSVKTVVLYGSGYMIPIVGIGLYLLNIGVWSDFWFWTIQFNATTYAQIGGAAPDQISLKRISGVLVPSVLLIFNKINSWQILLLLFILGGFFGGGNNFDFTYFQPVLPLVCLATVTVISSIKKVNWLLAAVLLYLLIVWRWLTPFYLTHQGPFVYYFDPDTQKVSELIRSKTRPGEEIFIYGATPLIYQMTDTIPAGKVFVFQFPWFIKDGGDRIFTGLQSSKPKLIVSDPTTRTKDQLISDYSPEINNYIYSNYHLIEKIVTMTILVRNLND